MAKRNQFPRVTDRGRELVSYVLNAAALSTHGDDAEFETMAVRLGTTPGRPRPMLRSHEAQGWPSVEGRAAEFVYPTVAA